MGERPTFNFSGEWRGPIITARPSSIPPSFPPTSSGGVIVGLPPTSPPSLPPSFARTPSNNIVMGASADTQGSTNQLYGGAECWVWILVAAILGVAAGYALAQLCAFWTRRRVKSTDDKGTTKTGGLLRDPLRELPAQITSDTMVSHVEMGRGSSTLQPAVYFPGQSLRSETRGDYPAFQHQPSESVLITGPMPSSTLRDPVEEKKQQQLEREKVNRELEHGMTLEGTSYQYFHPDQPLPHALHGDDDSPRVSFTFSG